MNLLSGAVKGKIFTMKTVGVSKYLTKHPRTFSELYYICLRKNVTNTILSICLAYTLIFNFTYE